MGGLGCDKRVVKICCSHGIEEEAVREGEDAVIIVGTSVMVWAAG